MALAIDGLLSFSLRLVMAFIIRSQQDYRAIWQLATRRMYREVVDGVGDDSVSDYGISAAMVNRGSGRSRCN